MIRIRDVSGRAGPTGAPGSVVADPMEQPDMRSQHLIGATTDQATAERGAARRRMTTPTIDRPTIMVSQTPGSGMAEMAEMVSE